jgi:predicted RNase H-like nuclease (RuvC/YqgF family)
MRKTARFLCITTAAISFFSLTSYSQDAQSLGDVARQTRQKNQAKNSQANDATGETAPASKVITNEEIPERASPAAEVTGGPSQVSSPSHSASGIKIPAEQWKAKILAQKSSVSSLQKEVDRLNSSIHFVQANLYMRGAQYNQRQAEKEQKLERMQAQLQEQKKRLENMQDTARKQGYGSSVYDP